jgi:hypothetical protein
MLCRFLTGRLPQMLSSTPLVKQVGKTLQGKIPRSIEKGAAEASAALMHRPRRLGMGAAATRRTPLRVAGFFPAGKA